MAYKRGQGERIGTVPYGFDLAADGVSLVPNDGEQRVLTIVAELRENGYSMRAIAEQLEKRGFKTKAGKSKWTHSTVQRILERAA